MRNIYIGGVIMADLSHIFDAILEKVEIVDVISSYLPLEKKGKNYFGVCPFHNDTNPSMSVSPEKKIYKCFSCGASGNAISFVQNYEHITFLKAAKKLADQVNVELVLDEARSDGPNFTRYYKIMQEAVTFYKFYLQNTEEGKDARTYLEKRGIGEEILKEFSLGLSSSEPDYLNKALTKMDVTFVDQMELGLIKSNGVNYYDSFRDRIMFPIHDLDGNVVGLSGRIYKQKDNEPKYVNSPENMIFHKGKVLYHYHQAMPHIRKLNKVFVFEGFMDVIAAFKAGVENTVASMGTALTLDHARALKKLTSNVVLCFDGDQAGITATKRAIPVLRGFNLSIEAVLLPDNLDPDDYLKKYGPEKLRLFLQEQSINVVEYLYRVSKKNLVVEDVSSIERHKEEVFSILKAMNQTVTTEVYLQRLASDTGVRYATLQDEFDQSSSREFKVDTIVEVPKEPVPKRRTSVKGMYLNAEKDLIHHMLYSYDYTKHIKAELGTHFVTQVGLDIMCNIKDIYDKDPSMPYETLISEVEKKLTPNEVDYFHEITSRKRIKEANRKLVEDCLVQIKKNYDIDKQIEDIKVKMSETSDEVKIHQYSEQLKALKNKLRK